MVFFSGSVIFNHRTNEIRTLSTTILYHLCAVYLQSYPSITHVSVYPSSICTVFYLHLSPVYFSLICPPVHQSMQAVDLSSISLCICLLFRQLSLYSSGWPLTPDLPAWASLVLRLQVCLAMTSRLGISSFSYLLMDLLSLIWALNFHKYTFTINSIPIFCFVLITLKRDSEFCNI